MSPRISHAEHAALLTDLLRFLHAKKVRAEVFGLVVDGRPLLVHGLRAGTRPTHDQEIRMRVVMQDWAAYGGAVSTPLDANLIWRGEHGFASKAEGIRSLQRDGLSPAEIARRLHLPPRHVSTVLARPELAPDSTRAQTRAALRAA